MKILELFAGIGACSKALERLEIEHEIVDAVEIDKYAIASFNAIHGTNFEPQDITKWDKDIEVDLIMQGSPCQDFSVAGKGAGGDKDSGTRSSLMYETIRIVEKLKPKYVIWENVKNILSKKHRHNFDNYLEKMEELGYSNYYQVLNAKDYGIPQNRERVFTISIKEKQFGNTIRTPHFKFPPKQELKLKLKDMLEDKVDEKYYLSDKAVNGLINQMNKSHKPKFIDTNVQPNENFPTLTSGYAKQGHYETYLKINNATKQGYSEAFEGDSINLSYPNSKTRRGRVGEQVSQTLQCNDNMGVVLKSKCKRLKSLVEKTQFEEGKVLNMGLYNQTTNENLSQCLTEPHHNSQRLFDGLRIRKLTPKECWRLMGFDDEDFEKAEKVNSNTQLYKQAGNSIVVNVLEAILKNLLIKEDENND